MECGLLEAIVGLDYLAKRGQKHVHYVCNNDSKS